MLIILSSVYIVLRRSMSFHTGSRDHRAGLGTPTAPMKREAASAGVLDTPFGKFARLQILTIEDLFAGKKPAMPPEESLPRELCSLLSQTAWFCAAAMFRRICPLPYELRVRCRSSLSVLPVSPNGTSPSGTLLLRATSRVPTPKNLNTHHPASLGHGCMRAC